MNAQRIVHLLAGSVILAGRLNAQYVGREACRPCHSRIYESHSKTGHAHALRKAPDGSRGQWAFGAGAKATTWVSQVDRDTYAEHGLSYFSATKSMGLTPGHTDPRDIRYRTFDSSATALKCFRCHSTGPVSVGPDHAIVPDQPGVLCESCHGPGAEHVNSKGSAGTILNPGRLSASALNDYCGACHRTGPETDWTDKWRVRHQPSYLNQAACFRKSNGALTCLTCHSPHAPLSQTAAEYDRKCAGCHKTPTHRVTTAGRTCIACHMPQVAINAQLSFTNHWIGIYAKDRYLVPARTVMANAPPPLPATTPKSPADPAGLRPLFEQALAEATAEFGADDKKVARAASDLGQFLGTTGNPADAEAPLKTALKIDEMKGAEEISEDRFHLARVLAELGRSSDAAALFRQAAEGTDAKVTAESLTSLAMLDPAHAEDYYRGALAAEEKAPVRNARQIATILNNLAMERQQKQDYVSAESLFRKALAVQQKEIGIESPAAAATLSNLGSTLETLGRHAEAEKAERDAIRIFEKALGPRSAELATSCANLADILASKGDRAQAASLYRRAMAIDESVYGPEHPELAGDLVNLGLLLKESGEVRTAEPLLRRALAIYEKAFGKNSSQAAQVLKALQ